ncbi:MAG: type II toxin-antitoxin system RelB/DinJ family antitoxin [Methanomassiliicoccaceae archaeon]|nr:type II toxin-antitoxin system RelB/DinJ family antitoxin [Methanomassiliicoccaceae archaeon]
MTKKIESGTIMISVRLDKVVKEEAETLFSELGMNMSTAINTFLRQSIREDRIPFEIKLNKPNAETIAAIEEVEAMIRGDIPENITTVDELFKDFRKK